MSDVVSHFFRYNEFSELHEKLKKKFNEANSLKLPGKRFLGNNFDPEFIKSRRERLNEFVFQMVKVNALCRFCKKNSGWCMESKL